MSLSSLLRRCAPSRKPNRARRALQRAVVDVLEPRIYFSIPNAPTTLIAATASAAAINLSWLDNSTNETGFKVEESTNGGASYFQIASAVAANATTYQAAGLQPNTAYGFRVRAFNADGNSAFTNVGSATTDPAPATPTGLTATAATQLQINLAWTDNATNETSYKIEESSNGGSSFFSVTSTLPANTTSYSVTGLTAGTAYQFRVRAANAANSAYSNTAPATTLPAPAAPTGLALTVISQVQINLAWTDNATNETNYKVEESNNGGTSFFTAAILPADTTSYSATGLTAATAYQFRVKATNLAASPYSNTVTGTTLPAPAMPTGLTATAISPVQIGLVWTDNATNETSYRVERSADGTTFSQIATLAADATSYTATGLSATTTYYFRVRAVNLAYGPYSAVASATTLALPAAPSGLAVTVSRYTATLTWTDNSSNEDGFKIERSTDGTSYATVATLAANTTTYADSGLAGDTTFYYRVRAFLNNGGSGAASNVATGTVGLPGIIGGIKIDQVTSGAARVTWTPSTASVTGYHVQISRDGGAFTTLADVAANVTTYNVAGLQEGSPYQLQLVPFNINGDGITQTAELVTDPSTDDTAQWKLIGTVTVLTTASPGAPDIGMSVDSGLVLEAGKRYRFDASGTFTYGGPGNTADAEFANFGNTGGAWDKRPDGGQIDYGIDLNNTNNSYKNLHWGQYATDNKYRTYFNGDNQDATFNYHDDYYDDNSGTLTVNIYEKLPPPKPPLCPCQTASPVTDASDSTGGAQSAGDLSSPSGGVDAQTGTANLSIASISSASLGSSDLRQVWTSASDTTADNTRGAGMTSSQSLSLLQMVTGDDTHVIVQAGGTSARYFDLIGSVYQERFGGQNALSHNARTATFALVDTTGQQFVFADFSSSKAPKEQGKLLSSVDAGGHTMSVAWDTSGKMLSQTRNGTDSAGIAIQEAYTYSYVSGGVNDGLVASVTLARKVGTGSFVPVQVEVFSYYDGTGANGSARDLLSTVIQDADGQEQATTYYRYYSAHEQGGYSHGLKYLFSSQSYARLAAAVTDPLTATDAQVAPYADFHYTYDSLHRVVTAVVQGAGCNCAGMGGEGTYTYAYGVSANSDAMNHWKYKTTETMPDGTQTITYSNYAYEVMLQIRQTDPTLGTPTQWMDFYAYDAQGRPVLHAAPSAVKGYDESLADLLGNVSGNYTYLEDSAGKIDTTSYYASTTATDTTAGGVAGYVQSHALSQGETGTPILQDSADYLSHSGGGATVYEVADATVYRNTDGTGAQTTSYSYTWFTDSTRIQSSATALPVVTSAQNGPGTADTSVSAMDAYGRPAWDKDAGGFISYTGYDQSTGAVTKQIQDVDYSKLTSSEQSSFDATGWSHPSGGLHLVSTYQVDSQGRITKSVAPNGNITYTVYNDAAHETRTYHWDPLTDSRVGPTQVTREDWDHAYTETLAMTVAPHLTAGVPDGSEAISGVTALSRQILNAAGQVMEQDAYFDLTGLTYATTVHLGTLNVNYYATTYHYDHLGRQDGTTSPTGTITRSVFDTLCRAISTWVGTALPITGWWSTTNPGNLVKITQNIYDSGGAGDSNLTESDSYPGGSEATHVTQTLYDWRNRAIASKTGSAGTLAAETDGVHRPLTVQTFDNLGQTLATYRFDGDGLALSDFAAGLSLITSGGHTAASVDASALKGYQTTRFDEQGRAFQQAAFSVDPATGAISAAAIASNTWYDPRGHVIKSVTSGGATQKTRYDGAGRATVAFVTDGGGDAAAGAAGNWADAGNVTGDVVLSQDQTTYDASGQVIITTHKDRFHDDLASATGELGDVTTGPLARVSSMAYYYDAAGRTVGTVNWGTHGGAAFTLEDFLSGAPTPSDTALVTSYTYTAAGDLDTLTDPRGIVTKTFYDALGQTLYSVAAWDGSYNPTNSSLPSSSNTNQTTAYTYDGAGHPLTMTAVLPSGQASETTAYVYGVTTASGESTINSNDLLRLVKYPDKTTGAASDSSSDQNHFTYNALGQPLTKTDQNGTTHTYTYDNLGRMTSDVVAVATDNPQNVDMSVVKIGTQYNAQGQVYQITSYDSADGVVNQIQRDYNGLGQMTREYQEHAGLVDTATSLHVGYTYSDLGHGSRLVSMTYPDGRVLHYLYGNAGSVNDTISRLSSLADDDGTSAHNPTIALESYLYLGLGTVVQRANPAATLSLIQQTGDTSYSTDGGDRYTGLDRFGRVIDQNWSNSTTGTTTDRFQYGYDPNSNVLYKNNLVNSAASELYHANSSATGDNSAAYDALNRLTGFNRGTLSSSGHNGSSFDTVASVSHTQSFSLDALGNMNTVTTDGSDQSQTFNAQNQTSQAYLYDNNGNTKGAGDGYYTYDAWNRMITGSSTYAYDGVGRRVLDGTDLYYSSQWQVLQEGSGSTHYQYVWSPVYVDALLLRDTKTPSTWQDSGGGWSNLTFNPSDVVGNNPHVYFPYYGTGVLEVGSGNAMMYTLNGTGSTPLYWTIDSAMNVPTGMAIDAAQNIYLVDGTSLDVYNAATQTQVVVDVYSASGVHPQAITTTPDGYLVMAGPEGVTWYTASGGYITQRLYSTASVTSFGNVKSMTTSSNNGVYLLTNDGTDNYVVHFGTEGDLNFDNARVLAAFVSAGVDHDGHLTTLTLDSGTYHLNHYTPDGTLAWTITPGFTGTVGMNLQRDGAILLYGYDTALSQAALARYAASDGALLQTIADTNTSPLATDTDVVGPPVIVELLDGNYDVFGGYGASGLRIEQYTVGQRIYVQQDANYNVTAIMDSSGQVLERYGYDPYGSVTVLNSDGTVATAGSDPASPSNYGWVYLHQGGRYDFATGLYTFRNRDYSPTMMRWMQQDPLGYVNGANVYQNEAGNPINVLDPTGLAGFRGIPYAPTWMNNMISGLDNFFNPASGSHPLAEGIDNNITPWFTEDPSFLGSVVPIVGPFRKATSNFATGHPVWGSIWVVATALDVCTLGEASVGRGGIMKVGAVFSDGKFLHMAWEAGGETRHLWGGIVKGAESLESALRGVSTNLRVLKIPIPILTPGNALAEGETAFNCISATIRTWSRAGGPLVIWAGWRTAQATAAVAGQAVDATKKAASAAVTAPASSWTSDLMGALIYSMGPTVNWFLP